MTASIHVIVPPPQLHVITFFKSVQEFQRFLHTQNTRTEKCYNNSIMIWTVNFSNIQTNSYYLPYFTCLLE